MGWTFYNSSGEQLIYDGGAATEQATQAEAEAESNVDKYIPPDLIKNSPGVAKVWVKWEQNSAHGITVSYNMTSVTDGGLAGDTDHLFDTDFSGVEWALVAAAQMNYIIGVVYGTVSAGGVTTQTEKSSDLVDTDLTYNHIAIFGDQ